MARTGRNRETLKEFWWDYGSTALEKDLRILPKTLSMHSLQQTRNSPRAYNPKKCHTGDRQEMLVSLAVMRSWRQEGWRASLQEQRDSALHMECAADRSRALHVDSGIRTAPKTMLREQRKLNKNITICVT